MAFYFMAIQFLFTCVPEDSSRGKVLMTYINKAGRVFFRIGDQVDGNYITMNESEWEEMKCYIESELKSKNNG